MRKRERKCVCACVRVSVTESESVRVCACVREKRSVCAFDLLGKPWLFPEIASPFLCHGFFFFSLELDPVMLERSRRSNN